MRTTFYAAALGLFLSAASSPPLLALGEEAIQVHVPFAFHVLDRTLPRGDYVIKSAGTVDPALLEIRNADGSDAMLFLTRGADPRPQAENTRVVFGKVGRERFLHAVLVPGATGHQLLASASEQDATLAAARATARAAGKTRRPTKTAGH
jgi:hypothetical protein